MVGWLPWADHGSHCVPGLKSIAALLPSEKPGDWRVLFGMVGGGRRIHIPLALPPDTP